MLRLNSTYIMVRDMERSVEFYSLLFGMEPSSRVLDRWAQYDLECGSFGVFNQMFDYKVITAGRSTDEMYNKAYIERLGRHKTVFGNNVIHHFRVDDLRREYERLGLLNIGLMSEILRVNISSPYFFFTLTDPDGNIVEIAGDYSDIPEKASASSEKASAVSDKQIKKEAPVPTEDSEKSDVGPVDIQPKSGRKEAQATKDDSPPADESVPDDPPVLKEETISPIWDERAALKAKAIFVPTREEPIDEKTEEVVAPTRGGRPGAKTKEDATETGDGRAGAKVEEDFEPVQNEQPVRDDGEPAAPTRGGRPGSKVKEDFPQPRDKRTGAKVEEDSEPAHDEQPAPVDDEAVDLHLAASSSSRSKKSVSLDEIRFAVQEENSIRPEESFIDHSILKAAILQERERQLRERITEPLIFKPIPPEPEPEEFSPIQEEDDPTAKTTEAEEDKRSTRAKKEANRPIWEEPMKDQWRDE